MENIKILGLRGYQELTKESKKDIVYFIESIKVVNTIEKYSQGIKMSGFNTSEELPLGLMMQLGQNAEVMSTFANLSDAEKMQIVHYIEELNRYKKEISALDGMAMKSPREIIKEGRALQKRFLSYGITCNFFRFFT